MKTLTVQQLIDELQKVEDKTIQIELCDLNGDRYSIAGTDIIYNYENNVERNFDINFISE